MKRPQLTGLSILSGLLLFAAWPVSPLTALIFIAWLPLLWIADVNIKRNRFFGHVLLTMLIWNTGTTWWIWNSTDIGTIAAILVNSLLMCLPWWGYHIFKGRYGKRTGYAALVACWMLFEYIHLNWQLSWPWLTLGNTFASHPQWVQWYEYTGVGGGSLWILLTNVLLFEILRNGYKTIRAVLPAILVLVIPVLVSFLIVWTTKAEKNMPGGVNVVIVQPNVDPYEKFSGASAAEQINRLIQLSEEAIDTATKLVIWPETAMSVTDWQENIATNQFYQPVFALTDRHPGITLLSGIETYKNYGTTKATLTARQTPTGVYYDAFNAAVTFRKGEPLQFYNKSKLVPGVESLPTFLNFMGPVFEKFGGTTGGYGKADSSSVFHVPGNSYVTAPIICYESIYGEYVGSYVQKGANLLTIMTNDGWWGNTPGHKQHLQYARLRAIETRRWVARSANTGISAVIDAQGNILETQPWDKAAVIKYNIPTTTALTLYVRFGDYLYKLFSTLAVLLIAWHVFLMLKRKYTRTTKGK